MAKFNAAITIIAIVFALFLAVIFVGGYLYMGADIQPGQIESKLAMKMVDNWLDKIKPQTANPIAPTPENLVAGVKLYLNDCAGCHGDQQNPESKFGISMYPPAPQFVKDAPDMDDGENFAVIKHGTRWTGMPTWKSMLTDQEIWQLATFLSHMSHLPPDAQNIWLKGSK